MSDWLFYLGFIGPLGMGCVALTALITGNYEE